MFSPCWSQHFLNSTGYHNAPSVLLQCRVFTILHNIHLCCSLQHFPNTLSPNAKSMLFVTALASHCLSQCLINVIPKLNPRCTLYIKVLDSDCLSQYSICTVSPVDICLTLIITILDLCCLTCLTLIIAMLNLCCLLQHSFKTGTMLNPWYSLHMYTICSTPLKKKHSIHAVYYNIHSKLLITMLHAVCYSVCSKPLIIMFNICCLSHQAPENFFSNFFVKIGYSTHISP